MRIKSIALKNFKRFSDLKIIDLPATAKLVVLAGPNGCGKSSLFDGLALQYQIRSGHGWQGDQDYYSKSKTGFGVNDSAKIEMHGNPTLQKGSMYFRSAYRNDPEFALVRLERMGEAVEELRFRRMIEQDASVSKNYQRLAAYGLTKLFKGADDATTIGAFREDILGPIKAALTRVFPDLSLSGLGDPLAQGSFKFKKGIVDDFDYKSLSGGEKAAFDLILDIGVKKTSYPEAIYCIDEPETHMNTRLQGALLQELLDMVPAEGQLWIATHSIGMMRKAQDLYRQNPDNVVFLDFEGHDFDAQTVLHPVKPNREFWERVLKVALDDLADLVAPKEVVLCEGHPGGAATGKNSEHDAKCYNAIFGDEFPDVKFISVGNSHDVSNDRLGLLAALPQVANIKVRRLIDRDDHSATDQADLAGKGIETLGRRHIESYLYDDEILTALCVAEGKPGEVAAVLADKSSALANLATRSKPADDIKSAAPEIFSKIKLKLGLAASGNTQEAFARNKLVPLVKVGTGTYSALKKDLFKV